MATEAPPPYLPQGSLAPSDGRRYRTFRIAVFALGGLLLLLIGGILAGTVYLVTRLL